MHMPKILLHAYIMAITLTIGRKPISNYCFSNMRNRSGRPLLIALGGSSDNNCPLRTKRLMNKSTKIVYGLVR